MNIIKKIWKLKSDLFSGLATALFSIPEGMAYAKLAGVNPIYGLYSGMIATIAAALTTGTVLMISTVTSAIAISTRSVLNLAEIEASQSSTALFTLTFLIGAVMFILGLLRLGRIVDFISNAVMTGFIVGASMLIIIGELHELVGLQGHREAKILEFVDWITHIQNWSPTTTFVGFGSIFLMLLLKRIPGLKQTASLLTILASSLTVYICKLKSVALISSIATISGSLPSLSLPDFSLMPRLAVGAVSIAFVALTQGAGVSMAVPNPSKKEASHSHNLVGEGIGNLLGSFFQSMGTGGSLSRTAINVKSGAQSRLSGVAAGLWLMLIVVLFAKMIGYIPLATISGVLCVIASEIILKKHCDIKLILSTSVASTAVMLITFVSALFIPLQWTIFLGAGLSLLFFVYTSATQIRLIQWIQNKDGSFAKESAPLKISSNQLIILDYEGNGFFGEVPAIKKLIPSTQNVQNSVIIWRMRGVEDVHSTFLKWMKQFIEKFQTNGNRFIIEGVEPHVLQELKRSGILNSIGKENIFPSEPGIFVALKKAIKSASV